MKFKGITVGTYYSKGPKGKYNESISLGNCGLTVILLKTYILNFPP